MKTINNDSFKVRVWFVPGGYYLPEFYLTPAGEVCEFGVFNGTPQVRKFDNQENFRKERCTGQTDMEGRLIFENDVVNVYRPMMDAYEKAVVVWADAESCWVCKWLKPADVKKDCWHSYGSGTYFQGSHCRVIGNIYEERWKNGK
jgi:hypothetical protein